MSWLMPSLIVWMLNGVVMAAVLAKLFVFGEPVTKPLTASSVSYWRSRRQADVYLAAVSYLVLFPCFCHLSVSIFHSSHTSLKVWKVLEFFSAFFKARKMLENGSGPGKSRKLESEVLESC